MSEIKYKLVPVEPTEEMLNAPNTIVEPYAAKLVYQRMLAAAPSPEGETPESDVEYFSELNTLLTEFGNAHFDCGAHEMVVQKQNYGPVTAAERYHLLSEKAERTRATIYKLYQRNALLAKPQIDEKLIYDLLNLSACKTVAETHRYLLASNANMWESTRVYRELASRLEDELKQIKEGK